MDVNILCYSIKIILINRWVSMRIQNKDSGLIGHLKITLVVFVVVEEFSGSN